MAVGLGAAVASSRDAEAAGNRDERRRRRGEVTATSPKLSTHAYVNDSAEEPLRLTLYVDTFPARRVVRDDVMSLRVGLGRAGAGGDLPLSPRQFELTWPDASSPVIALTDAELAALPDGRAAHRRARQSAALAPPGSPFDGRHGSRIGTQFYKTPPDSVFLHDETTLPPASWFVDLLHFRLPPGAPPRVGTTFRLAYLEGKPAADDASRAPLVTTVFRVEEDPQRQQEIFRRSQRGRRPAR